MHIAGSDAYIRLLADKYFDSEKAVLVEERVLFVVSPETGLIHDVAAVSDDDLLQLDAGVIDLRGFTVLPGLCDTHVHLFLHPYTETSWEDQLTKESLAERTVRAVHHARATLLAGYTTVRDLGTEGAGDADVALRDCLAKGLMVGPRYYIANRALVASGSYGPKSSLQPHSEGVAGVTGAQAVDGLAECVKAVRQQIGAGADCQVYADYPIRSRVGAVAPVTAAESIPLFSKEELRVIIETAHARGVKVAAHANNNLSVGWLISLGVDSIEHGYAMNEQLLGDLAGTHTTWTPTLAAYFSHPFAGERWDIARETFSAALKVTGLKIACGGDTGVFAHGDNVLELKLMVQLGAPWGRVLQSATLGGWECMRSIRWEGASGTQRLNELPLLKEDQRMVGINEMPFGVLRKGFAADLIATRGSLTEDFESAVSPNNIILVMKSGTIYKDCTAGGENNNLCK